MTQVQRKTSSIVVSPANTACHPASRSGVIPSVIARCRITSD
jgi:hypothetical protein